MVTLEQVKELISLAVTPLKLKVDELEVKLNNIEQTASYLSEKYDSLLDEYKTTNKKLHNQAKEVSLIKQDIKITDQRSVEAQYEIEELAQYIRRDCVEITGIYAKDEASSEAIVKAIGNHIGSPISAEDISVAHPLPTKNTKAPPKIIVKFISRKKRNIFYNKRKMLQKTKVNDIADLGSPSNSRIYISESLTPKRKKLFGEVNRIKKRRNWKFIWTQNGRIFLKEDENSVTYSFNTEEDLEQIDG